MSEATSKFFRAGALATTLLAGTAVAHRANAQATDVQPGVCPAPDSVSMAISNTNRQMLGLALSLPTAPPVPSPTRESVYEVRADIVSHAKSIYNYLVGNACAPQVMIPPAVTCNYDDAQFSAGAAAIAKRIGHEAKQYPSDPERYGTLIAVNAQRVIAKFEACGPTP